MSFSKEDVYLNIWTNFSSFEITATHLPTGISIKHQNEYLGDNWFRTKKEALELLQDKLNARSKRKGK